MNPGEAALIWRCRMADLYIGRLPGKLSGAALCVCGFREGGSLRWGHYRSEGAMAIARRAWGFGVNSLVLFFALCSCFDFAGSRDRVGLLALPLCGAAPTFFAAAKKVGKESSFPHPERLTPAAAQANG
ncbi:hypothetical protein [Caballeronia pedi]|uniref:hypothetical protein n=1 Tax=Caballeronia pedi TaxID=1777141 RepID=UPI00135AF288|nr:hypothetical protein [Caballeronia pedi]